MTTTRTTDTTARHDAPAATPATAPVDVTQLGAPLAWARCAIGASFVVAPGLAARTWLGATASNPATRVMTRAMGVRDLALGAGAAMSLTGDDREAARGWVLAGAASDAVDAAATLLAWRHLPRRRRWLVLAAASTAAAAGALAAAD